MDMTPVETLGCGCIVDSLGNVTPCAQHVWRDVVSDTHQAECLIAELQAALTTEREARQQAEREREKAMQAVAGCLSPENQNVINGDLVASIRDMAQVYVTSKDNAHEAMLQLDAANQHVKIMQGIAKADHDGWQKEKAAVISRLAASEQARETLRTALAAICANSVGQSDDPLWIVSQQDILTGQAALHPPAGMTTTTSATHHPDCETLRVALGQSVADLAVLPRLLEAAGTDPLAWIDGIRRRLEAALQP